MEVEELNKVQSIQPTPIKRRKPKHGLVDHEVEERNRLFEQQILEAETRTETYGMSAAMGLDSQGKKKNSNMDLIAPHFESHGKGSSSSLPSVPPPRPNSQGEARRHVHPSKGPAGSKSLPTQFKCHGQFCDLHTVDPAPLQSDEEDGGSNRERALRIAKQVLSANEMKVRVT